MWYAREMYRVRRELLAGLVPWVRSGRGNDRRKGRRLVSSGCANPVVVSRRVGDDVNQSDGC